MKKTCEKCGVDFNTSDRNQKFCSRRCMAEAKKKGSFKRCQNCGKEMWCSPWQLESRRYCSRGCADSYKKRDNYFTCKECGKDFYSSHQREFCSRGCSNVYISREKKQATLSRIQAFVDLGGDTIGGLEELGMTNSHVSKVLLDNPELRKRFKINHSHWEDVFKEMLDWYLDKV